jgi:CubicO group peptidase (beta-lactamase class C family)
MAAEVKGTVAPGLESVRDAFAGVLEADPAGAAVAVDVDGELVVDLWGGLRDAAGGLPWERDTLVHSYSVSKPFAAIALLLLADRAAVGLDEPVAAYWPEFAAGGKASVPVRWLLTHQAGLEVLPGPQPPGVLLDWERFAGALAAARPNWEPGTRHGEHALTFGHLVGEVVRRADGRTVGRLLREELPWLDFRIGLTPEEQERCADVVGLSPALARDDRWLRVLSNPPGALDQKVVNSVAYRAAQVPAINGHGTARAVARFYGVLLRGGLLSEGLRERALSPQVSGVDVVIGRHLSWGLGLQVDDDGFGMGGLGGAAGLASRTGGYGMCFLPAHMSDHGRADRLERVLRECLDVPPLE